MIPILIRLETRFDNEPLCPPSAPAMRAFVVKELNHPSKIELTKDAPEPKPAPDQVLVDVYSAGLNFYDVSTCLCPTSLSTNLRRFFFQILQAQGKHQSRPELPFILGSEFAGIISRGSPIPPGCSLKPGDRVFGYAQGAYADKALADPGQLLPLPKNLTFDQGAGKSVPGFLSPSRLSERGKP